MKKLILLTLIFFVFSFANAGQVLWYLPFDSDMNDAINGESPTEVEGNTLAPAPYTDVAPSLSSGLTSGGNGLESGGALDMRATMEFMGQTSPANYGGWVRYGTPEAGVDTPMEDAMDGLLSFSFMGWMNTKDSSISIGNNTRAFARGSVNDFTLLFNDGAGPGRMKMAIDGNWNGTGWSDNNWGTADQWVFFAATYDGTLTTNNLKYYVGDLSTNDVELVSTFSLNTGALNSSGDPIIVGNNGENETSADKGFKGLLDELRLYGSHSDASGALDVDGLSAYKNDVFTEIPEPTTMSILALGAFGLIRKRWK
jgi:hypothetical protein